MKVKAISLWEPWASLMRSGHKTIETRSWSTYYRGPLLICASQRWEKSLCPLLKRFSFQDALKSLPEHGGKRVVEPKDLLFGQAVCLVDLVDCGSTDGWGKELPDNELEFGDFSPGRYGLITMNLRTFEPFPVKGRQGLFEVELPRDIRWVA